MSDPTTGQMDQEEVLRVKLDGLKREHRSLDEEITAMEDRWGDALLEIKRLKKKKLRLKDEIASIEDRLTPDIIA